MFSPLSRRSGVWFEAIASPIDGLQSVASIAVGGSGAISVVSVLANASLSINGTGALDVVSYIEGGADFGILAIGVLTNKSVSGSSSVQVSSIGDLQTRQIAATSSILIYAEGALQYSGTDNLVFLSNVSGPVAYTVLNDEIYWTDGTTVGQVKTDGTVGLWGMAVPPEPQVTAVANGGLFAGTYQVAMTALHLSGLESGAVGTVSVDVSEGGGIQVAVPNASGVSFALYRTGAEGGQEELRRAIIVAPGSTTLLGVTSLGKHLESLHAVRPLPGQALTTHKGRIWCASGSVVWFTDTKSPHWLFPRTGYYQFESRVVMLASSEDGVYVATANRTYFLQGNDPYKMTQRPVAMVGAATGSAFEIPYDLFLGDGSFPSKQAAWWDANGDLCIGKPGGIIIRPAQKQFNAGNSQHGAMTYRAHDGLRQLVSVVNTEIGSLTATDTAITQVFANGVVLG